MKTAIFVGFRHDGIIQGCTWHTNMDEYTPRKEKALYMIETTSIDYARDIFDHIHWNPSDLKPRDNDGIHLIKLIKVGIDEYRQSSKEVFKFLNGNRKGYDVKPDLAQYVATANGKTMAQLFDSSLDYHQNKFDIALIFDLDAGRVETVKGQPTSVQ